MANDYISFGDFITSRYGLFFIVVIIIIIFCICFYRKKKHKKWDVDVEGITFASMFKKDKSNIYDGPKKSVKKPTKKFKKPLKKGKGKDKWVHEKKCREVLEGIFKQPSLRNYRPVWLKNPVTKQNLELDVFFPDIKTPIGKGFALEYDGIAHSKFTPFFHKTENAFKYQHQKDRYKKLMCQKYNIMLLNVPYFILYYDLERFIRDKLRTMGMANYL
jgi:hypothetical protein